MGLARAWDMDPIRVFNWVYVPGPSKVLSPKNGAIDWASVGSNYNFHFVDPIEHETGRNLKKFI